MSLTKQIALEAYQRNLTNQKVWLSTLDTNQLEQIAKNYYLTHKGFFQMRPSENEIIHMNPDSDFFKARASLQLLLDRTSPEKQDDTFQRNTGKLAPSRLGYLQKIIFNLLGYLPNV